MTDQRIVTVYSDYKSPYAYLAKDLAHQLERDFPVHDTPTRHDPQHRTVELPKPVTHEVAELFNRLLGRSKPP